MRVTAIPPDRLIVAISHTVLIGILVSIAIFGAGINLRALFLIGIVLAIALPVSLRALRGQLDLFEPIVIANLALGIMFVGRPLIDLTTGETYHLGYDVLVTFNETLLVAFIGILSFQMGYFSPIPAKLARCFHHPLLRFIPGKAAFAAWAYTLLGAGLFWIFLVQTGRSGILFFLLSGRAPGQDILFRSTTGYFYQGLLAWAPAALIFFALATTLGRRRYLVPFALTALGLLVYVGTRGDRSNMLPMLLSISVFWYLQRNRRPRMLTLVFGGLVAVSLLGFFREIRTVGLEARENAMVSLMASLSSPIKQAGEILKGADAEMFDSLANELMVIPSKLPYQHGSTVTDILIRAVPRTLWRDKPLESNDSVVNKLWPVHYTLSRASPAFSIIGPFYADSGLLTVVIGMFAVGVALRAVWIWFVHNRVNFTAQLIYSMALPFVVILLRGSIPDTLSRMLFMVIPLLFLPYLFRLRLYKRSLFHWQAYGKALN